VGPRENSKKAGRLVDQDKDSLTGEAKECMKAKQRRKLFTTSHQQADV